MCMPMCYTYLLFCWAEVNICLAMKLAMCGDFSLVPREACIPTKSLGNENFTKERVCIYT